MVKVPVVLGILVLSSHLAHAQVLQNFESGQGDWYADQGVWEVGLPTASPAGCHQGTRCAGTILNGNSPDTDSRLVSPMVRLPHGTMQNPVLLRFWHWFDFFGPDYGVVQISTYDETLSTWSPWADVGTRFAGASGAWTFTIVDLTLYSGRMVRLGFQHRGAASGFITRGWYLDDIEFPGTAVAAGPFTDLQNFEAGQGDWYADNGVWEVGLPTGVPASCPQGTRCAGTILNGNSPDTDSRLISPAVRLGQGTALTPVSLRFWHWFDFFGPDYAVVQISAFDEGLSAWSAWTDVGTRFTGKSGTWTLNIVDLTLYSGRLVRLGFQHRGAVSGFITRGWYLDDIAVEVGPQGMSPTISDITNQTIAQGASTAALAFMVGDTETPVTALTVSASSSNATLVPPSGFVLAGAGANRTITITPAASQVGTATITVTVTDGDGLTASDAFLLTVVTSNDTDNDGLPNDWETQFGLNPSSAAGNDGASGDPDGDGMTNSEEYQNGTHPRGFFTRYFAEGATGTTFNTRLALLNPSPTAAVVLVRFLKSDGTVASTVLPVGAQARATLDVAPVAGMAAAEFSTVVEADQPVVLDRTMTWSGGAPYGAHAETAMPAAAATWYLAEGATHGTFNLFYLLQNPHGAEVPVRVRYLRPSGGPLEKTYALPPTSRTNIWVDFEEFPAGSGNRLLANTDVSAVIETLDGAAIIVERAMYADVPGQFFGAGHESAGVTAPAAEWFLAEGATGPYFDLFVLIANPTSTAAQVEATYLLPDGTTIVKPYTVGPSSRFNIWVDHEDARLADTAVSTTVRVVNDVPVIVERAMWWPGPTPATWYEAHNSAGATTTGTRWALAEGEVDTARNLETYILVANTSATPADVKVTLLFEDGTRVERTYPGIPAKSRFNVPVGYFFAEAAGKRFGAIVESLGTTPAQIVVERAMYWDAAGQRWAAGTNALATKLQ